MPVTNAISKTLSPINDAEMRDARMEEIDLSEIKVRGKRPAQLAGMDEEVLLIPIRLLSSPRHLALV
jgi:hypothetical protein